MHPRRSRRSLVPSLSLSLAKSLVFVVLVGASACTTWSRRDVSSGSPSSLQGSKTVRVTRTDHSQITIDDARIVGDSLVGDVGDPEKETPQHAAVALRDIARVDVHHVSAVRTTALVAVSLVLVFGALLAAAAATLAGDWN
ncbi:MAG TPA: hypothetical protein VFJ74_16755 [Gemmatimonadaceae bacterium]|nr:hypothetical protein [Gemmatimonadaceae bacterium]